MGTQLDDARHELDEALFGFENAFDPTDLPVYLPPVPRIEVAILPDVPAMPVLCLVPAEVGGPPAATGEADGYQGMTGLPHGVYEVCPAAPPPPPPGEETDPTPGAPREEAEVEAPPPEPADLRVEVNAGLRLAPGETVALAGDAFRIGGAIPALIDVMLLSPPAAGALLRDGFALTGGDVFTQEDVDLGRVSYRHDPAAGGGEDRFSVATPAGEILSLTVEVVIRPRRQAPRLCGGGRLDGVWQGITVAELLDDGADAPVECGVAVVGAGGVGAWSVAREGEAAWQPLEGVRPGRALLLGPRDRLRFIPRAAATVARLSYRAWDQTAGQAGGRADLAGRHAVGGATAFSREMTTASARVAPPSREPPGVAAPWGEGLPCAALCAEGVAVVRVGGDGVWQWSLDGLGWRDCGAVYHGRALLLPAAARLRFLPRPDAGGKVVLSVRAWDGAEGRPGDRADLAPRGVGGDGTPFGPTVRTWCWRLSG